MLAIPLKNDASRCIDEGSKINSVLMVILGSVFMALSAQVSIPFQPVPISLQSFAALFIGMVLGPRLGCQAVLVYLAEGVCGLPVFAGFSFGLPILLGPTGGYLLGMPLAALLLGYLLEAGIKRQATLFLAVLVSDVLLMITGYFWLSHFVGFHNAYLWGVAPFILVEGIKLAFLAAMAPLFWKPKK